MPARASTFNSIGCTNSLGGSGGPPRGPPDAENRRFSELIKRIHTNERRSPGGLHPKRPYGPFGSFLLITECLLGRMSPTSWRAGNIQTVPNYLLFLC